MYMYIYIYIVIYYSAHIYTLAVAVDDGDGRDGPSAIQNLSTETGRKKLPFWASAQRLSADRLGSKCSPSEPIRAG